MFCVPGPERVFWRTATCTVWVGYDDAGALVFNGVDAIMRRGERTWLDDHGLERAFNSY
jgi:hypothetical protein